MTSLTSSTVVAVLVVFSQPEGVLRRAHYPRCCATPAPIYQVAFETLEAS